MSSLTTKFLFSCCFFVFFASLPLGITHEFRNELLLGISATVAQHVAATNKVGLLMLNLPVFWISCRYACRMQGQIFSSRGKNVDNVNGEDASLCVFSSCSVCKLQ